MTIRQAKAMSEGPANKLYSPKLLGLSASLADFPMDDHFQNYGDGTSRTCGSTIKVGLTLDGNGRFARVGMQVAACAVGQSSAAILAGGLCGREIADLVDACDTLKSWLSGEGSLPDWPAIDALEPALPYSGRHEAIELPWRAAIDALSSLERDG